MRNDQHQRVQSLHDQQQRVQSLHDQQQQGRKLGLTTKQWSMNSREV
jgi:hypothetical protein